MVNNFLNWEDCSFTWDDNNFTWEEVFVAIKVGGSSYGDKPSNWYKVSENLTEREKEVFIKLVCKVNELKYEENKSIKKKNIYITAKRIQKTLNKVNVYMTKMS